MEEGSREGGEGGGQRGRSKGKKEVGRGNALDHLSLGSWDYKISGEWSVDSEIGCPSRKMNNSEICTRGQTLRCWPQCLATSVVASPGRPPFLPPITQRGEGLRGNALA